MSFCGQVFLFVHDFSFFSFRLCCSGSSRGTSAPFNPCPDSPAQLQEARPKLSGVIRANRKFKRFRANRLDLSGPLNRLNAIVSLLQPLDRYRTPSAIGSAIGRPYLALSRTQAQVEVLNCLILNRLGGSTAR